MKKIVFICIALCASTAHAERLRIVINDPNFKPYPIAAPELTVPPNSKDPRNASDLAHHLTRALQSGVQIARSLELVAPGTYLSPERENPASPNYTNWANVGAVGLIRGTVDVNASRATIALRFYDISTQREVISRTCTEESKASTRCINRFLDEVTELLTGEKGIFSSKIAFIMRTAKGKAVYTCDIDGSNIQRLTDTSLLSLLPTWSPNGRDVLFTSYLHGNPDLYRIDINDNKMEMLSNKRGLNTGASVSPDGKRIALTLSSDGNTEIYVMDINGKNLIRLTDSWGQDVSPTWSPDGKRIAFVSSRAGAPHIYIMDSNGGNVRRLTFKGNYNQEPDWSPRADGQIAFTGRDERLKYDLFLVNPDTGEITRLTQDTGDNESPSFSPDGQLIVFTSNRNKSRTKNLYVMDIDGSNQRPVNLPGGDYESPSWGPRAP